LSAGDEALLTLDLGTIAPCALSSDSSDSLINIDRMEIFDRFLEDGQIYEVVLMCVDFWGEAKARAESDPAVKKRNLVCELHPRHIGEGVVETTKPTSGVKTHYIALPCRGTLWSPEVAPNGNPLQQDRLRNFTRMAESGTLVYDGPFELWRKPVRCPFRPFQMFLDSV